MIDVEDANGQTDPKLDRSLATLLRLYRRHSCQAPKDKVYALLHLDTPNVYDI